MLLAIFTASANVGATLLLRPLEHDLCNNGPAIMIVLRQKSPTRQSKMLRVTWSYLTLYGFTLYILWHRCFRFGKNNAVNDWKRNRSFISNMRRGCFWHFLFRNHTMNLSGLVLVLHCTFTTYMEVPVSKRPRTEASLICPSFLKERFVLAVVMCVCIRCDFILKS